MANASIAPAPDPWDGMGAVLHNDNSCTFRVWAPFADKVSVVGSFTAPKWTAPIQLERQNKAPVDGHDYWSVHVNGVRDRDEYKFIIWRGGKQVYKVDPYCRDATGYTDKDGRPRDNNSIVDDPAFDWGPHRFRMPNWNELVIYEMHIGTFNNTEGTSGTFDEALDKLHHLEELGVNAIEVMPSHDFAKKELDRSIGYDPSFLFAIDSAYGTQNAVQKFVKTAHSKGIAVIFDVVYNHFEGGEGEDGLWHFDGWYPDGQSERGGIYFYTDYRWETDWGGARPDFGRPEVRQFICDNALMWLHEYQADGLRFDSTSNIRYAIGHNDENRGWIEEGWQLMRRINDAKDGELPWNLNIAEDLREDQAITLETGNGGAGFNSQWDQSFFRALRDAVVASSDDDRRVVAVAEALRKRYNNDAFRRVIYSESHDEVKKGTGGRLPEQIWWDHLTWPDVKKRSSLAATITFTAPGIPMIFQGQEFLEWGIWTDDPDVFRGHWMLDWAQRDRFPGIFNLYQRLITLRRNRDNNTKGLTGQHLNVFHINESDKVLAYHR